MKNYCDLKVGDIVVRKFGNKGYEDRECKMELKITKITGNFIYCGSWKFSMINGAEIDEELGWDEYKTGSQIFIENEK